MSRSRQAVILGATGPTGIHLAEALRGRVDNIRVVSRKLSNLQRAFPGERFERVAADALDAKQTAAAVDGCDVVYDCIGLPPELMDRHGDVAGNVAAALRSSGARGVQISSYWSYMPVQKTPLDESHPRRGGPQWARMRREAEDILQQAGAVIVQLPDFFGPDVHTSSLQGALEEAASGKTMNWIGSADARHDFIYVPDAMRVAAQLAEDDAACGERFLVPGSGAISGNELAAVVSEALDREIKVRGAGPLLLRIVSLFNGDLRAFMPMVPEYAKPISYDGSKLEALIGQTARTSYPDAIRETLRWIAAR
ncbi:MAG: NAD(P)H-binding protein [Acidobacteriota bacterium]|jgi:nucleoside-diphosphate-sugar epimerase